MEFNKTKTLNLLQVGALNRQKNQEVSIRVLKNLLNNGFNARLTLVGDGYDKKRLVSLTESLNIVRNVDFAGYIQNQKLSKYYKKADLILMPSINETFPAVPLEALKEGKQCIISADSGSIEVLNDFCMFAKPTVSDFTNKVQEFLNSKAMYTKMALLGKQWIKKKLTWENYTREFLLLVEPVVPSTIYDKAYFDVHHENPRSDHLYLERQTRIHRGIELLKIKPGMKVLDLGCGNGEVVGLLLKNGVDVWGIDYSKEAIKIAKKNNPKASLVQGRISKLPYKNNLFDRVISLDVFEHVYPRELEETIVEIKRVIKPGGKLVVATAPNSFYLKPIEVVTKIILGVNKFESDEYHINVFNYFRFKNIFKDIRGNKNIFLTNDGHHYFESRIIKNRQIPKWIKLVAKVYDFIFENPISEFLILNSPLKILFAHDLWADIDLKKKKD